MSQTFTGSISLTFVYLQQTTTERDRVRSTAWTLWVMTSEAPASLRYYDR
jgi:hypothetical protein